MNKIPNPKETATGGVIILSHPLPGQSKAQPPQPNLEQGGQHHLQLPDTKEFEFCPGGDPRDQQAGHSKDDGRGHGNANRPGWEVDRVFQSVASRQTRWQRFGALSVRRPGGCPWANRRLHSVSWSSTTTWLGMPNRPARLRGVASNRLTPACNFQRKCWPTTWLASLSKRA